MKSQVKRVGLVGGTAVLLGVLAFPGMAQSDTPEARVLAHYIRLHKHQAPEAPPLGPTLTDAWSAYLSNANYAADPANAKQYLNLSAIAMPHLDESQRGVVRQMIQTQVLPGPAAWAELDAISLWKARECLNGLEISDDDWAHGVAAWFLQGDNWRNEDLKVVFDLYMRVASRMDAEPIAEQLIAAYRVLPQTGENKIVEAMAAYVESGKSVKAISMACFALPELEEPQQLEVIEFLRQRVLNSPQAWSGLTSYDIERLWVQIYSAFEAAPNSEWFEGAKVWLGEGEGWRNEPLARVSRIYGYVSKWADISGMDAGLEAYFASKAAVDRNWFTAYAESVAERDGIGGAIGLMAWGVRYLDDAGRASLAQVVQSDLLGSDKTWSKLSIKQIGVVETLSEQLDLPDDYWAKGVIAWFDDQDLSQDQPTPGVVGWIDEYLERASNGVSIAQERAELKRYASAQIRSNPSWLDSPESSMPSIVRALDLGISADHAGSKNLIYNTLFADESRIAELDVWRLRKVSYIARRVGVKGEEWTDWVERWIDRTDALHQGNVAQAMEVLSILPQAGGDQNELQALVLEAVMQRSLADPGWLNEVDANWLAIMARRLHRRMDSVQQATLARAMIERLAYGDELKTEPWHLEFIASLFHSPELRSQLRDALLDESGTPRRNVGLVLNWTYVGQDELHDWRAFLEEQAQSSRRHRDARSKWLLIRGEAAFSHLLPADPSPTTAVQWGEDAYGAASSDESRCVSTEWLVRKLVRRGETDAALRRVDICLSDVTDIQLRRVLQALRARLIASLSSSALPQS